MGTYIYHPHTIMRRETGGSISPKARKAKQPQVGQDTDESCPKLLLDKLVCYNTERVIEKLCKNCTCLTDKIQLDFGEVGLLQEERARGEV
jgi:hypothetical protein